MLQMFVTLCKVYGNKYLNTVMVTFKVKYALAFCFLRSTVIYSRASQRLTWKGFLEVRNASHTSPQD